MQDDIKSLRTKKEIIDLEIYYLGTKTTLIRQKIGKAGEYLDISVEILEKVKI